MASRVRTLAKFVIILFLVLGTTSIIMALAYPFAKNIVLTPYSVISESDNGLSRIKSMLHANGFETKIVVSDPEAAINIRRPMIYSIIGPTLDYDIQSVLTLLSFLQNGSSLLIVDDFGRANTLLKWLFDLVDPEAMFRALFGEVPSGVRILRFEIYFNTTAVIMDAENYWQNPAYLLIQNFDRARGVVSSAVQKVLAKFATTLFVYLKLRYTQNGTEREYRFPIPPMFGFMLTSRYSWLETDLKSILEGKAKPDASEIGGIEFVVGVALDLGFGRIVIITDPDIFTNGVLKTANSQGFDNERFVLDIYRWLSRGVVNLVVFDESRKAITPENPLFGLAIIMKAITAFTRYWIISPFIPILFLMFFIIYLPHRFKTEIKLFKISGKKLGTPPYYGRYLWYMYKGGYISAFRVIVDNFRRTIKVKLGITSDSWDDILEILSKRRPDLAKDLERIKNVVEIWKRIVKGKYPKLSPDEFVKMILFIESISKKL